MNAEGLREFLLGLPNVHETQQFGGLVFWVGDKAIGGKMFALINLDEPKDPARPEPVMSLYAGPEAYSLLLETEGVMPAPYMARNHWVALRDWQVYRKVELERLLTSAYEGVQARLPKRTRLQLALPAKELGALIAARRKQLATKKA